MRCPDCGIVMNSSECYACGYTFKETTKKEKKKNKPKPKKLKAPKEE